MVCRRRLNVEKLCSFNDDAGRVGCRTASGEAFREMPPHVGDIHNQIGSCFGLVVPGHLLELVGTGVPIWWALRMVPDVSEIFEDRQPVWVLPAVRYLSDCPVMQFGLAFAFLLGCPAKCDHVLTS